MTPLGQLANQYVTLRRRMGFKFVEGAELLADFIDGCDSRGESVVTAAKAITWARSSGTAPNWWAKRLSIARGFARFAAGMAPEAGHQVPPPGAFPTRPHRATPFIYGADDIVRLMMAARGLPSPWWAIVIEFAIGFLAVTGLRVGELVRLDTSDIDWTQGMLTVRSSKFGKSRLLPLHPSALVALRVYSGRRERPVNPRRTPALLVSTTGARVRYDSLHRTFRRLVVELRLRHPTTGQPPRVHDLRHTFAVSTLFGWYRSGIDVASRMHLLSAYLGHRDAANTYWYLSAAPELMTLVADRLDATKETLL